MLHTTHTRQHLSTRRQTMLSALMAAALAIALGVPSLSTWGILPLALLLAATVIYARRRAQA